MTESNAGRVIVIDDDHRVREALSALFASSGVDATFYSSARDYIDAPALDGPACLVLDIGLADINGLDLQDQMASSRHPPIVFITGNGDVPSTVRAMKAGAVDFLTKPFSGQALLDAVSAALRMDREARLVRAEEDLLQTRLDALTRREREVLSLVVSGLLNKQAAAKLGISEVTLQIHRGNVMRKMQARSLAELVRMSARLGIPERPAGDAAGDPAFGLSSTR